MGNCCGSSNEGGPKPSCSYFFGVFKIKKTEYKEYFTSKSSDGGKTAQILEPGTTAILKHKDVVGEMDSFCERWTSGKIYRGNDLSCFRFNTKMWEDISPQHITIGATVEQHALFRPIVDEMFGPGKNWNEVQILNDAMSYLQEDIIKCGRPLSIPGDVKIWTCKFLHMIMFNMKLSYEEAKCFVETQDKIFKVIGVPECALNLSCKVQEVTDFRKQKIAEYKAILSKQYPHLTAEADLHLVTVAMFDTVAIAGAFPANSGIHTALAVLHSKTSPKPKDIEITEENLPAFIYEVIRFYPIVDCIPYYTGADQKQRRLIQIVAAHRDPSVWGDDCDQFRMREIAEYQEHSALWGEKMVDKENPANNRVCPGKDLSYQLILNFVKAVMRNKNILVNQSVDQITIVPEINAMGNSLTLSEWKYETEQNN